MDLASSFLGGNFYENQAVILDVQHQTEADEHELRDRFQALYNHDYAYCQAVQGAALEDNLWVVRNRDASGLSEADLRMFKNIAWNELIVRKYLPDQVATASTVGTSLLDIIRNLNLQWHNIEIRGLHPKVEAAEKQLVLYLMQNRHLAMSPNIDMIALQLRRSPTFSAIFANAVGCRVCALTGRTPGLSKTQYNTDLDYVYKTEGLLFLVQALKTYKLENAPQIDYVAELSKLVVINAPPEATQTLRATTRSSPAEQPVFAPPRSTISADQIAQSIRPAVETAVQNALNAGLQQRLNDLRTDLTNQIQRIQVPVQVPAQVPVQVPAQVPVQVPVQVPAQVPVQVPVPAPVDLSPVLDSIANLTNVLGVRLPALELSITNNTAMLTPIDTKCNELLTRVNVMEPVLAQVDQKALGLMQDFVRLRQSFVVLEQTVPPRIEDLSTTLQALSTQVRQTNTGLDTKIALNNATIDSIFDSVQRLPGLVDSNVTQRFTAMEPKLAQQIQTSVRPLQDQISHVEQSFADVQSNAQKVYTETNRVITSEQAKMHQSLQNFFSVTKQFYDATNKTVLDYKSENTTTLLDLKDSFATMHKDVTEMLHPFVQTSTLQHLRPANPLPIVNPHNFERAAVI